MTDTGPIKALAKKCALAGLRLRDANFLFDALYVSDSLAQTHGNKSKAAGIAGMNREALTRLLGRGESAVRIKTNGENE